MHTPIDYQLDYLSAQHLIYYAFPPKYNLTYYKLSNKEALDIATQKTASLYSHILDDTSIAEFYKIENVPVYFTESSNKQLNAQEYGTLFNQQQMSIVLPAIYGIESTVGEFVVFSTTETIDRLYVIENIEISNIHELGDLRYYKLNLRIDKNITTEAFTNRISFNFEYSQKFATILSKDDQTLLESILLPLIVFYLSKVGNYKLDYINVILSKMYQDYKDIFKILLEYNSFINLNILEEYQSKIYSNILDTEMLTIIPNVTPAVLNTFVMNLQTKDSPSSTINQLYSDIESNSIQFIDYFETAESPLYDIAALKLLIDKVKSIIGE